MGKSLKETVRGMVAREKAGETIKKTTPEDPMIIKSDNEEEPSLLSEMTSEKSDEDFSSILKEQGNKSEPEKKETTDLGAAEGTEDEAPQPVETKPNEGTDIVPEFEKKEEAKSDSAPIDSGRKIKVKTVYGEEELTETELSNGYRREAHYTQVMQQLREQEKIVRNLLSNPQELVEWAMQNGIDLRPLVHAEQEIPEFQLPELSEYATDTEKAMYVALKNQNAANKKLWERVSGFERNFKQSKSGERNNQVEKEFRDKRGDIPETAAHAVYAMYKEGQRLFGKAYTVNNALKDFEIAEGDVGTRWLNSPKGKTWLDAHDRQVITDYSNGKIKQREENLAPDNLTSGKGKIQPDQKPKITGMNWRELAKRSVGIKN